MAVECLPNELIDCILDNLSSDKKALHNCSLIKKALVVPSQHLIFAKIELDGRARSLQYKTEQLIVILDEKPHLTSGVQLLNFQRFNLEQPEREGDYAQIAKGVIQRVSKVDMIELKDVYWSTSLCPLFRTAVFDAVEAPSLI
ncbi:hypothetical protein BT96DRAFT_1006535 [Gymnopus androsaceus JB14]|uniref:F-box domain-containing protein n=1 Tax=Gymnopus androsaceus JB14 TaxID=1447944 RepID=A0A6A4GJS2_9AGAR|nr:hypothetical protein BT96DRAFT_1006535 [Gymnopus androsaceus JB14]